MKRGVVLLVLAMGLLVGLPLLLQPRHHEDKSGSRVVIITPHNEQIRFEFSAGFGVWHKRHFGQSAQVEWSTPGGTSEIRRLLLSQYTADLEDNPTDVGGTADLIFGGGSFEFAQLCRPISVEVDGETRRTTILESAGFSAEELTSIYGPNELGGKPIYDPEGRWFGVALSSFGIVSNTALCAQLGVAVPTTWQDLTDPRLFNAVSMANPAQSGSVATAFETILLRLGWQRGWQVLRRAAANSRSITGSSAKPPIDVAEGESACGVAIDFYGRAEAQSMREASISAGEPSLDRVVFHEARGESMVDADPIALLRGAPHREIALRFIRYCLSPEGQALWQLEPGEGDACGLPRPRAFALRRMPALRSMYACCDDCFIDKQNPFETATPLADNPNFRPFVTPVFAALAVDNEELLSRAWQKIFSHPAYPRDSSLVSAEDVTDPQLRRWITLFDSMPTVAGPDASRHSLADPNNLSVLRAGWIRGGWKDAGLWNAQSDPSTELRRDLAHFFEKQLEAIIHDTPEASGADSSPEVKPLLGMQQGAP
ncbi:MAG: extracellular solute-binding protein [Phycisphaerales bacterium]|nr:extracellular solute-binding protein [Phycisphaerales bacterium]